MVSFLQRLPLPRLAHFLDMILLCSPHVTPDDDRLLPLIVSKNVSHEVTKG